MFTIKNNEKYMICPFDYNHAVLPLRYENHVRKCSLKHKLMPDICPFNAKHHVEKGELRAHLNLCPDKYRAEKEIINQVLSSKTNKENASNIDLTQLSNNSKNISEKFSSEENWDNDIDIEAVATARIKTIPDKNLYTNQTKSERKKVREMLVEEYKKKLNEQTNDMVDPLAKKLFETKLSTINENENYSERSIRVDQTLIMNENDDLISNRGSIISTSTLYSRSIGRGHTFASTLNSSLTARTFFKNDTNSIIDTYSEIDSIDTTNHSYASCVRESKLNDKKLFE